MLFFTPTTIFALFTLVATALSTPLSGPKSLEARRRLPDRTQHELYWQRATDARDANYDEFELWLAKGAYADNISCKNQLENFMHNFREVRGHRLLPESAADGSMCIEGWVDKGQIEALYAHLRTSFPNILGSLKLVKTHFNQPTVHPTK